MKLKDEIKKSFSNKKEKIDLRFLWAKVIFLITCLAFFTIFYLAWAWIWWEKVKNLISPVYILLIINLNIFIYFLGQKIFFSKKIFSYIFSFIFLLLSIFFLIPLVK